MAQVSESLDVDKSLSLKEDQTYILMPIEKNKILVRFENLADKIDNLGKTKAQ